LGLNPKPDIEPPRSPRKKRNLHRTGLGAGPSQLGGNT
jgi:hypothetical protein